MINQIRDNTADLIRGRAKENRFINADNPFDGFVSAVNNNQTLLALEHAILIFDSLLSRDQIDIDSLKNDLEEVKKAVYDGSASTAPSRKVTKKGDTPAQPPVQQEEDTPAEK